MSKKNQANVHVNRRTARLIENLRKRFHNGVEVSAALIVRIAVEDLYEAFEQRLKTKDRRGQAV